MRSRAGVVACAVSLALLGPAAANIAHEQAESGLQARAGKILGELGTAEGMLDKLLKGHPDVLGKEEKALHKAEAAAHDIAGISKHIQRKVPSLVETGNGEGDNLQKAEVSMESLQALRRKAMKDELREERRFGAEETSLAKDGKKILSEFSQAEDSIAQAFAGKDSKGVKEAMEVGEILEKARAEQEQVTKLNIKEAAKSRRQAVKVEKQVAALAQSSVESKEMQEQHAYTSGMKQLAKDDTAVLSEFSQVKGAIANAFAGQDSQGVEKAMEVGELLDQARKDQQQVTEGDAKDAKEAPKLFRHFRGQRHASLLHKTSKNHKSSVHHRHTAESKAQHRSRLQSLLRNERRILSETNSAEAEIRHELRANSPAGEHAAATIEQEVMGLMEKAKHAEHASMEATDRRLHIH